VLVVQKLRAMQSIVLLASLVFGCGDRGADDSADAGDQPTESARQAATSSPRTLADFQALRYLEGDWRGSGYAGGPFYESYRFVDDSTITMTAWSDSTLAAAREQSRYLLRDGIIRTDDGARLVRIDAEGHHFQRGSSNWAFRQVSPDRWTARVGPSTTYTMDRIGRR
jgi:hypothetical protein